MSEILFKSICFDRDCQHCDNKTDIKWHHETCSSSSNEYLNDNGYIRCSECGSIWPLLRTKFNCSMHSNINAVGGVTYQEVLIVLSNMASKENNPNFMRKLVQSIMIQQDKFH